MVYYLIKFRSKKKKEKKNCSYWFIIYININGITQIFTIQNILKKKKHFNYNKQKKNFYYYELYYIH